MGKFIDLTGQRFGKLVVVSRVSNNHINKSRWLCVCDCGKKCRVLSANLRAGFTSSCGCLVKKSNPKYTDPANSLNKVKEYRVWKKIRGRCCNKNDNKYSRYGGRGITVCDRWLSSYENFLNDMGKCPDSKYSIDRIDNDGNYSPDNCVWSSFKEQSRNRSSNVFIEYNGVSHVLSEWAEITGLSPGIIRYRLKAGWGVEKILTYPIRIR